MCKSVKEKREGLLVVSMYHKAIFTARLYTTA